MVETRSRARGAGPTTPHTSLPEKTPGAKSTRATRSKKAKEEAQDDVAQKLKFQEEPSSLDVEATSSRDVVDADTSGVDQQTAPENHLAQQVEEPLEHKPCDAMSQDSPVRGPAILPGADDPDAPDAATAAEPQPHEDQDIKGDQQPLFNAVDTMQTGHINHAAQQIVVEQPAPADADDCMDETMAVEDVCTEHVAADEASYEQDASCEAQGVTSDQDVEPMAATEAERTADQTFEAVTDKANDMAEQQDTGADMPAGSTPVDDNVMAAQAGVPYEQLPIDEHTAADDEEALMPNDAIEEQEVAAEPSLNAMPQEMSADTPAEPELVHSDDVSTEQQVEQQTDAPPTSPLAGLSLAPSSGAKYVSKTPQPRKASTSKIAASLTAAKPAPSAGTPYATRRAAAVTFAATPEPRAGSSGAAKAVHKTPATKTTPMLTAATNTTTGKSTHKSVLKPSTTFKTPTAGSRTASRTGDAATAKSSKRVSISSPVQQSAPRPIPHLTPYPKSAGKPCDMEDDDEEETDNSPVQDQGMADTSPSSKAGPSTAPEVHPITSMDAPDNNEMADVMQVEQELATAASGGVDMEMTMDAVDDTVASTAVAATEPTAHSTPVMATRPASSGKYAKAHNALQSLAAAEAQASGSSASAIKGTPSYMAPTSAALSRAKMPVKLATKPNSPDQDPRSLNQIRRQIKEVAAAKATKPATKPGPKYSIQPQVHTDLNAVRKTRLVEKVEKKVPQREEKDIAGDHDQSEAPHDPAAEEMLMSAMGGMNLGPETGTGRGAIAPLKGVPVPQGRHVRFTSKGKPKESPSNTRPVLRGVPAAEGKHLRFKD